MLLDCAKLAHWRCEADFGELFSFERDYMDWICLSSSRRNRSAGSRTSGTTSTG